MTTDLDAVCPTCHITLPNTTCMTEEDSPPRPGDFSVCMNCGEILVFEDSLLLIYPNSQEFQALFDDSEAALYMLFKLSHVIRHDL